MRTLHKPSITHREILESCISNIRDSSLIERVEKELEYFALCTEVYDKKGVSGELSDIPSLDTVNDQISRKEMEFLYDKIVTKGQPGRRYYDKILHSSKLCPMCGFGLSKTLDHYLPKAKFPIHAVNPFNLIPCCRDCNSVKGADEPTVGKETLHPYYDEVGDEKWLYAEIEHKNEVGFKFNIKKPSNWTDEKFNKLNHHFITFELSGFYSVLASSELNDQVYNLKTLWEIGGPGVVRDHLLESQISVEKTLLNHWKSAMYEGLANSEWFCSAGIANYPI